VLKLGKSVNPLQVYVAQPSTGKPEAAVILFPDVYGWDYNNTRIWADRLAKVRPALHATRFACGPLCMFSLTSPWFSVCTGNP